MTKIVSLINLKGGVAKTTSTIQIAECLASEFDKRVLVVDLDPQTNATISLIPETKWVELDDSGRTLFQLFKDKIDGTCVFNIETAIQKKVSTLKVDKLHLLASSIRFIELQDRLHEVAIKTSHMTSPYEVLKQALKPLFNRYDYILIDCPPNLGYITLNGIEISDYYLIPTIPDTLSTYGIPQIIQKITSHSRLRNLRIKCLGLLVTKFDSRSTSQNKNLQGLPNRFKKAFDDLRIDPAPVFQTKMPQATATAAAMDFNESKDKNFNNKYGVTASGYQKLNEYVKNLTKEFIKHVN